MRVVEKMPSGDDEELARGGHAGRRVGDAFGEDFQLAEALIEELADDVVPPSFAAARDCWLHVQIKEPKERGVSPDGLQDRSGGRADVAGLAYEEGVEARAHPGDG